MNKVAAFALRRKNSILSMSEKMFCPPQPLRFWITPACAGKSRRKTTDRFCSRDHPRVCGEKKPAPSGLDSQQGSPPACAGKSASHGFFVLLRWDHPRVCGEKQGNAAAISVTPGSPPRVRGKVVLVDFGPEFLGITPACAGKSRFPSSTAPYRRDHPRVCGEKLSTTSTDIHPAGSPPRMRGKVPSSI